MLCVYFKHTKIGRYKQQAISRSMQTFLLRLKAQYGEKGCLKEPKTMRTPVYRNTSLFQNYTQGNDKMS